MQGDKTQPVFTYSFQNQDNLTLCFAGPAEQQAMSCFLSNNDFCSIACIIQTEELIRNS